MDYETQYRDSFSLNEIAQLNDWDLFITGHNLSDRVKLLFESVPAKSKVRLLFKEYALDPLIAEADDLFPLSSRDEATCMLDFCSHIHLSSFKRKKVAIDTTGFLQPHLLFLLLWLARNDFEVVDFLYAQPELYSAKELTSFVADDITEVRGVMGYEGSHPPGSGAHDVMLIGAGYDDHLLSAVANHKPQARKLLLFGFPGSRPEMYQESLLRADWASEALGILEESKRLLAPATDPFLTALELRQALSNAISEDKNIYLAPVGPKPHVLGFGLFYLAELCSRPATLLLPFAKTHYPRTSKGLSRVWLFRFDFRLLSSNPGDP